MATKAQYIDKRLTKKFQALLSMLKKLLKSKIEELAQEESVVVVVCSRLLSSIH